MINYIAIIRKFHECQPDGSNGNNPSTNIDNNVKYLALTMWLVDAMGCRIEVTYFPTLYIHM